MSSPIVKTETRGNVKIYHVKKMMDNAKVASLKNTFVKRSQIHTILDHDADVYTEDGDLLLKYRKNKLSKKHMSEFYDNVIEFAVIPTSNRGSASGSEKLDNRSNPKIMTNIIGYFDRLSPRQKFVMKQKGRQTTLSVRETRFMMDYPDKFKKLVPLVSQIDNYYEKYIPEKYAKQKRKANQTPFRIGNTAFTTITTNVNFQTTLHKDAGDDEEGFGNLTVIAHGKYEGGETCFPQYGVGVNVEPGDVLFMNVHEWHGNLPIKPIDKDAKRLSIVCYLRTGVWSKTARMTKKQMMEHLKAMRKTRRLITQASKPDKKEPVAS